jgi:hypothetical protein
MTRTELEHVLRAASAILDVRDLLVMGSAAVLASFPDERLPLEASRSDEADLAAFDDPGDVKADLIDGAIGELSLFHDTFGYYAQGVTVDTAVLPDGWRDRVVVFDTPRTAPGRGLCLEPHDLVVSKLVAGREKDLEFAAALLREGLVDAAALAERVGRLLRVDGEDGRVVDRVRAWIVANDPGRERP